MRTLNCAKVLNKLLKKQNHKNKNMPLAFIEKMIYLKLGYLAVSWKVAKQVWDDS